MFEKWKQQRLRRRAQAEARHLAHEARRIIKKKRYRIPDAVVSDVESAVNEVEQSLKGEDHERTRQALSRLDEKMDEHLAFARKSSLREYAESIGVAVAIALLLRAFVVEAFQIPSGSMIPTLEIGDHIFVSKFSYGIGIPFTHRRLVRFGQPKRGDIIVFRFPLDPDVDYIKRVVALPGEKVEVRKNEIFINGRPMSREFVKEVCRYEDGPPVDGLRHERECERWLENLDGRMHTTIHNPARHEHRLGRAWWCRKGTSSSWATTETTPTTPACGAPSPRSSSRAGPSSSGGRADPPTAAPRCPRPRSGSPPSAGVASSRWSSERVAPAEPASGAGQQEQRRQQGGQPAGHDRHHLEGGLAVRAAGHGEQGPVDVLAQPGRVGVAIVALLGHHLEHDRVDLPGDGQLGPQARGRGGVTCMWNWMTSLGPRASSKGSRPVNIS